MAETRDPAEAAGPAPPETRLEDTDLSSSDERRDGRLAAALGPTGSHRDEPQGPVATLRELVPLVLSALVLAILI